MSETQLYSLAHKARAKLSFELSRPNHKLRLLVGHLNLLDTLMLDIAKAEQKQELWFNQCIRSTNPFNETQKECIQQLHSVPEEPENDWLAADVNLPKNGCGSLDGNKYSGSVAEITPLGELSLHAIEDGYRADDEDTEDSGDSENDGDIFAPLRRCQSYTADRQV